MKILINAISTKRHAGGAFQISQNFLIRTLLHTDIDWYYIISQDVDDVIGSTFTSLRGTKYFVLPTQPDFHRTYFEVKNKIRKLEEQIKPDVVYSITAPSYFKFKTPEVMRFTNPWITHPNKYSWSMLSWKEKLYYYVYGLNQKRMMRSAHYFITQTETCASGICRVTGEPNNHVVVVNNVLPAIFKSIDNSLIKDDEWINIACVGNPTPHKNFDIIPAVILELEKLGIHNVRFHMTLPTDDNVSIRILNEIKRLNISERVVNHERIVQKELAEVYRRCQFAFLPTLLEVFSASTVEAMYFNLLIVATDFDFNTEILADSCLYYEPQNAYAAAQQFSKLINDKSLQEELKHKMQVQLTKYGNYETHFNLIKEFLIAVAEKKV